MSTGDNPEIWLKLLEALIERLPRLREQGVEEIELPVLKVKLRADAPRLPRPARPLDVSKPTDPEGDRVRIADDIRRRWKTQFAASGAVPTEAEVQAEVTRVMKARGQA